MSNEAVLDKQINIQQIRADFPVLHQKVNGKPLIYFDNAATTQKPAVVLEKLGEYYKKDNANIHRGIHTLAERATASFEDTRKKVKEFINAKALEEVIFTKGTTESINLVASSFGKAFVREGDEILISAMEHHANIVPWQILCEEKGATLKVVPVNEDGELVMDEFRNLLSDKTRLVSVVHVSNTLGTVNPVDEIIGLAHEKGAKVLVDGAQAGTHMDIDVQALDCDFYVFSAHKLYGPTGIGILYGKQDILEAMPPYQGGGEMIKDVSFEKTTYNDLPYKFEAGTPNIAGVSAFGVALEYIERIGKENIAAHEHELLSHAYNRLKEVPGIRFIGTAKNKVSVVSFVVDGVFHFDLGQMLDANGIAVRTGHHCTQPLMTRYGVEGTVRASFSVYNTKEEIDYFADSLIRIVKLMQS